jgi:adenylate cyclase
MEKGLPEIKQDMVVLFADVSGSTRLYETLGDERAFSAISQCLALLRRVTEIYHGRVVKMIGDEIMTVFPNVLAGVQAACAMQAEVDVVAPLDNVRLAIRIGLHYGPVLAHGANSDVFGDTVNVAARLTELANAGQIISSESTVAGLPPLLRASTRVLDAMPIKGKSADIKIVEVLWQESEDETLMVGHTHHPARQASATLQLSHHGREMLLNGDRHKIVLGRDEQADFVVVDKRASRLHATIELRRDKFVFIDQSSNGSYITFSGENELQLRREEIVLRSSGIICLGHSLSKDPAGAIAFSCGGS